MIRLTNFLSMVSVCLPSDALLQHLPFYLGFSYLGSGVSLHSCSSKAQPLLLTLDEGYGFSSGHVWTWELEYKKSWMPKNWFQVPRIWIIVLEKILESPLDCKEIQPVHLKGDQSWVFIGRTDVEVETPVLWHLMQRADSFEETLVLRKIEVRRRRGQ